MQKPKTQTKFPQPFFSHYNNKQKHLIALPISVPLSLCLCFSPDAFWCPHKHPLAKTSQNAKNPKPKPNFHNHFSLITIRNKNNSYITTHFFTISLSLSLSLSLQMLCVGPANNHSISLRFPLISAPKL
jgi:hypothetical protein